MMTSAAVGDSRREQNKRDKHNRIVGAARALFHAQGYRQTTTQQVAKAAGIASGTLFLYAPTKGDLLLLVFSDEMLEVLEQSSIDLPEGGSLLACIWHLFAGMIEYHAQDVATAHELIRELASLGTPERAATMRPVIAGIHSRLVALIDGAVEAGQLATVDADLLADALFGNYMHLLQGWLSGAVAREACETKLRRMFEFLLAPYQIA